MQTSKLLFVEFNFTPQYTALKTAIKADVKWHKLQLHFITIKNRNLRFTDRKVNYKMSDNICRKISNAVPATVRCISKYNDHEYDLPTDSFHFKRV